MTEGFVMIYLKIITGLYSVCTAGVFFFFFFERHAALYPGPDGISDIWIILEVLGAFYSTL